MSPVFSGRAFAGLRRLKKAELPEERCGSCATGLDPVHQHMVDCSSHRLLCVCKTCAMMLGARAETRFRVVTAAARPAADFRMTDLQWEALRVPVALAFVYLTDEAAQAFAVYPSPAGPVASGIDAEVWAHVVRENPILRSLQPFVEALLVNRMNGAQEYLLAPIDECYRLVGIVRLHWRGFGGGAELQEEVAIRLRELQRQAARVS